MRKKKLKFIYFILLKANSQSSKSHERVNSQSRDPSSRSNKTNIYSISIVITLYNLIYKKNNF